METMNWYTAKLELIQSQIETMRNYPFGRLYVDRLLNELDRLTFAENEHSLSAKVSWYSADLGSHHDQETALRFEERRKKAKRLYDEYVTSREDAKEIIEFCIQEYQKIFDSV